MIVSEKEFSVTKRVELAPGVYQLTTSQGRLYEVPGIDHPVPSATNALAMIGKSALVAWSARVEREAVVHAAVALHADHVHGGGPLMTAAVYEQTLLNRLGKDKAHVKELEKAGAIGSNVHACIEHKLRKKLGQKVGKAPALLPDAAPCFAAYERWEAEAELDAVSVEQTVWSSRIGFAGTCDFIGTVSLNGKRVTVVGDWKSSKAIYREAFAQVSAYCAAAREMGLVPQGTSLLGLIVRLPKTKSETPEPEYRFVDEVEQVEHLEAFKAALKLWCWSNE